MSKSTKTFWLLTVSQAFCLAFGFWFQERVVIANAEWTLQSKQTEQRTTHRSDAKPDVDVSAIAGVPLTADVILESMTIAGVLMFVWTAGLQLIVSFLILSRMFGEHSRQRNKSHEVSVQQAKDLIRTQDTVIFGLAKLAEFRDQETGHHLERIALYSTRLATELMHDPQYRAMVTPTFVWLIGISSALHDIGKVGVEDAILLKDGKLNDEERFRMQLHVKVGGECIRKIEHRLGGSNFLQMAREIVLYHHEHWDGTGYPHGLAGEDIPLAARIVTIADVYDALSVRRIYKSAFDHEECVRIIRDEAGRHFDPELVEIFLKIESEFREIAQRFEKLSRDEVTGTPDEDEPQKNLTPDQEKVLMSVVALSEEASESPQAESLLKMLS